MSNTNFCSDTLLDYLYTQTLPTPLPPDYTKDDFSKWQIKKRNEVQDLLRIQELSNLLSVPVSAQLIEQFYTDDVLIEKYCLQGIRHLNTPLFIAVLTILPQKVFYTYTVMINLVSRAP